MFVRLKCKTKKNGGLNGGLIDLMVRQYLGVDNPDMGTPQKHKVSQWHGENKGQVMEVKTSKIVFKVSFLWLDPG